MGERNNVEILTVLLSWVDMYLNFDISNFIIYL